MCPSKWMGERKTHRYTSDAHTKEYYFVQKSLSQVASRNALLERTSNAPINMFGVSVIFDVLHIHTGMAWWRSHFTANIKSMGVAKRTNEWMLLFYYYYWCVFMLYRERAYRKCISDSRWEMQKESETKPPSVYLWVFHSFQFSSWIMRRNMMRRRRNQCWVVYLQCIFGERRWEARRK